MQMQAYAVKELQKYEKFPSHLFSSLYKTFKIFG